MFSLIKIVCESRTKSEDHATMEVCTTETGELSFVTALNLSSYNYLGFAESDLEMREEVGASKFFRNYTKILNF